MPQSRPRIAKSAKVSYKDNSRVSFPVITSTSQTRASLPKISSKTSLVSHTDEFDNDLDIKARQKLSFAKGNFINSNSSVWTKRSPLRNNSILHIGHCSIVSIILKTSIDYTV